MTGCADDFIVVRRHPIADFAGLVVVDDPARRMIVHVQVPMHRHSLAPEKIAEWVGHMLDPDNDVVRVVTVTDDDGDMLVWRRNELPEHLTERRNI